MQPFIYIEDPKEAWFRTTLQGLSAIELGLVTKIPIIALNYGIHQNLFKSIGDTVENIIGISDCTLLFSKNNHVKFTFKTSNDNTEIIEISLEDDTVRSYIEIMQEWFTEMTFAREINDWQIYHRLRCMVDVTKRVYKHIRGTVF
jgi:hypothetical protein